jgi:hypothetical protein
MVQKKDKAARRAGSDSCVTDLSVVTLFLPLAGDRFPF